MYYIKEGTVLLLLFPSLSLSPLIGLLKDGVCVCCFVLSGCYVVMLCVIKKKKKKKKKKINIHLTWIMITVSNRELIRNRELIMKLYIYRPGSFNDKNH